MQNFPVGSGSRARNASTQKKLDFVVTYSSAKLNRPFVDLHHFYFPFSPDPKIQSLLAK
jgi:hypothetical protein